VAIQRRTDVFLDDIGASAGAWRKVPLLPVVTIGLAAGTVATIPANGNFAVLLGGFAIGLFYIGWFGTQFIWYQRAFEGQPIRAVELWSLTWGFIARYVRLYFLWLIPVLVLVLVAVRWSAFGVGSLGWRIGVLGYILAIDIANTFITPTLAFSTRKVTKAVPIGFRMLASGWPEDWKYAVIPGVAAAAFGGLYWLAPSPGRPALEILAALTSLLFAGAIARYYLRHAVAVPTSG